MDYTCDCFSFAIIYYTGIYLYYVYNIYLTLFHLGQHRVNKRKMLCASLHRSTLQHPCRSICTWMTLYIFLSVIHHIDVLITHGRKMFHPFERGNENVSRVSGWGAKKFRTRIFPIFPKAMLPWVSFLDDLFSSMLFSTVDERAVKYQTFGSL